MCYSCTCTKLCSYYTYAVFILHMLCSYYTYVVFILHIWCTFLQPSLVCGRVHFNVLCFSACRHACMHTHTQFKRHHDNQSQSFDNWMMAHFIKAATTYHIYNPCPRQSRLPLTKFNIHVQECICIHKKNFTIPCLQNITNYLNTSYMIINIIT